VIPLIAPQSSTRVSKARQPCVLTTGWVGHGAERAWLESGTNPAQSLSAWGRSSTSRADFKKLGKWLSGFAPAVR